MEKGNVAYAPMEYYSAMKRESWHLRQWVNLQIILSKRSQDVKGCPDKLHDSIYMEYPELASLYRDRR